MVAGLGHYLPNVNVNLWPFTRQAPPAQSPFANVTCLVNLVRVWTDDFTLEQLKVGKDDLKRIIPLIPADPSLGEFLRARIQWSIDKDCYEETKAILLEIFDVNKLKGIVLNEEELFKDPLDLARNLAENYPLPHTATLKEKLYTEWKRFRPLSLYLIPNIASIFVEFFNYFNSSKKYTTFWEKQMIVETVLKFALLLQLLDPIFVTPLKVYLVAGLILIGAEILSTFYNRWMKTTPNDIVNCKNLDRQFEMGLFKPKEGQTETLNKIINAVSAGQKVLLVGKSGEGKTALIYHLVQLKKEGKLPPQLSKLAFFGMNCGDIVGHGTFGQAEMMNQTKEKIEGIEKNLFMFFDDLDQFTAKAPDQASLEIFKKLFLSEDEITPKVVAATTMVGYEKLKELDKDGSFQQRVIPIFLEPASDDQCRLVLGELVNRKARELPLETSAIEQVIKLSKDRIYLDNIGRIAKVHKIMEATIALCKAAYEGDYITPRLALFRDNYRALEIDPSLRWERSREKILKRDEARRKVITEEKNVEKLKEQAKKIKKIIHKRELILKEEFHLATQLLAADPKKLNEKKVQQFLLQHLAEDASTALLNDEIITVKSKGDAQVDELNEKMNVVIDAKLVEKAFDGLVKEQFRVRDRDWEYEDWKKQPVIPPPPGGPRPDFIAPDADSGDENDDGVVPPDGDENGVVAGNGDVNAVPDGGVDEGDGND